MIYEYRTKLINIDDYTTIEIIKEIPIGYSSFEQYLKVENKTIDSFRIDKIENHYNVMGLINNQWIKLKVCKTINGAKQYIKQHKYV